MSISSESIVYNSPYIWENPRRESGGLLSKIVEVNGMSRDKYG